MRAHSPHFQDLADTVGCSFCVYRHRRFLGRSKLHQLPPFGTEVTALKFGAGGNRLAVGYLDSSIRVWKDPKAEPETPSANKPLGFELKELDSGHPYFAERGLEPQTVEHFGLGFCQKGTMAGRVVIPMHNADGELVGYAGRWPGEPPEGKPKYKLPKGFLKTAELFNFHRLSDPDDLEPLVIVEGFFDCMWLWQNGFASAPGCATSAQHYW